MFSGILVLQVDRHLYFHIFHLIHGMQTFHKGDLDTVSSLLLLDRMLWRGLEGNHIVRRYPSIIHKDPPRRKIYVDAINSPSKKQTEHSIAKFLDFVSRIAIGYTLARV